MPELIKIDSATSNKKENKIITIPKDIKKFK